MKSQALLVVTATFFTVHRYFLVYGKFFRKPPFSAKKVYGHATNFLTNIRGTDMIWLAWQCDPYQEESRWDLNQ